MRPSWIVWPSAALCCVAAITFGAIQNGLLGASVASIVVGVAGVFFGPLIIKVDDDG